jgi:transposase
MTSRKAYTREFKLEVLELARTSGKPNSELEDELGLYHGQISAWRRALGRDQDQAFPGTGHLTDSAAQLAQLRRENEILRQERDILKKAVAIFSRPPQSN